MDEQYYARMLDFMVQRVSQRRSFFFAFLSFVIFLSDQPQLGTGDDAVCMN